MEQMSIFDFLEFSEKQNTSSEPTSLIVTPNEIKFTSVIAYSYIRECDNRKMVAFMCECENGMLYRKEFYTYHHMVKNSKKNKDHFYKEVERNKDMPYFKEEKGYIPDVYEMHRCKTEVEWDYAEKRYSGCEDSNTFLYKTA